MTVLQAMDGMSIKRDHFYVIPPGAYLSVTGGALRLSQPQARHGARLPFDFLLHSLAAEFGARAICVILSGTGADGSLGLKTVKDNGGLVIAQNPDEAAYDGMPRSAILTGAVDLVLPVEKIPEALVQHSQGGIVNRPSDDSAAQGEPQDCLPGIIELLRAKTAHDFTLYKPGTLQRRIERRMAILSIGNDDMARYLELLRTDSGEAELLAKDLLINVTSFFRDSRVFDLLARTIVPELVRAHSPDQPLRIWVAGCSTGEETYSLAMLFREEITAANLNIKLQFFASDVDADAITAAREGFYPDTIEAEVSRARLSRFFSKEDHGYRVLPELRGSVVFTVQDVLADPPFSRLDLVSCRNLLIYLRPEAQARVIAAFHFALREGGVLLLGTSETISDLDDRFESISKPERIYRHIGHSRPGEFELSRTGAQGVRVPARAGPDRGALRQAALGELCRTLVIDTYAPAAVLINRSHECLYSLGPTDRYLHVPAGNPTHDLFAMARPDLRTKLRSAIQRAGHEKSRIVVPGGRPSHGDPAVSFNIHVQPVQSDGDDLLLICFVDAPTQEAKPTHPVTPADASRVAELEQELKATRIELQGAIHNLETASEEQKAINEEALSVNEEYQSTNEELLTSKEELQSLNEELTALNSQLQETLERQRTTSNDLQNVLFSTDVATLFLDVNLNIRFFTPATKSLFNVIPSDIGRPLADLHSLAADSALLADAATVLRDLALIKFEFEAPGGVWYKRRLTPYRNQDNVVEGVVITFTDVTERRRAGDALVAAKRQADQANVAKSRFLAAASHDLRQPLQTLALLEGLLAKNVEGEKAKSLVARLEEATAAMSSMLNTLLDINQIEAGTVRPDIVRFPVNDLLERLRDEFCYHAQAQGLDLRTVPCGLSIRSDPHLLEQMIRNLVANALKYTRRGKVLLGCRRRAGALSIEIWDTGIGIPREELQAIFEEYHQLDNAMRDRTRGLGLGLPIVQRLGTLLGHHVTVRSQPGKGSVFAIEIANLAEQPAPSPGKSRVAIDQSIAAGVHRAGTILVVEDDPEVRELLEIILKDDGHHTMTASDGIMALDMVARGGVRPDLILADFNLPNGLDGLQLTAELREKLHFETPVIILTGDISTGTLREIALQNCVQLNKPVKATELIQVIQGLLPKSPAAVRTQPPKAPASALNEKAVIFVVDDDSNVRSAMRSLLEDDGKAVEEYGTCEAFLEAYRPGREACLLIDAYLPGMTGLELLQRLRDDGQKLPSIMITGHSDVEMVVQAMKAGALDFIEKPVGADQLLSAIDRALEQARDSGKLFAWRETASNQVAGLTPRQREIMELVLAGHPSKNIAADLGISQRTVENHRASIMKKTGSKSVPALARLAIAASWNDTTISGV